MSYQTLHLTVPKEREFNITQFSPEEISLILDIGIKCLLEGRKSVAGLTQQEIYLKIKEDTKKEVEKLEIDIMIEKESSKKIEEKIVKMYEYQIDQLKNKIDVIEEMNLVLKNQKSVLELDYREKLQKEIEIYKDKYELMVKDKYDLLLNEKQEQLLKNEELTMMLKNKLKTIELDSREKNQKEIENYKYKYELLLNEKQEQLNETQENLIKKEEALTTLKIQLKTIELDKKEIFQKEIENCKDKYELLLNEKDIQNKLNREAFEKAEKLLNKNLNKSSKEKGFEGEDIFSYLSDIFKDFNGYRQENKSKQGHKGDFHLHFKEFNVLVDSKNYSTNIQKKEIDKIKNDLITNDNVNFAWLVSLNSDICGWNRFLIMSDWIKTDNGIKCVIFVNNLLNEKEPTETLRLVWSICNEFNKFINNTDIYDEVELKKYKEKEIILNNKIKNLQNRSSEMKRNINNSINILKEIDNDLMELLTLVSNEIINNNLERDKLISNWWQENYEFTGKEETVSSTEIWNKFKRENKEKLDDITLCAFKEKIIKLVGNSNYVERTKNCIEIIGYSLKEKNTVISVERTKEKVTSANKNNIEEKFIKNFDISYEITNNEKDTILKSSIESWAMSKNLELNKINTIIPLLKKKYALEIPNNSICIRNIKKR